MVVEEEHTVEALQKPTPTHTPHQPIIIEEEPAVPETTRNTSASFQIPIIITQEALQAVILEFMTHIPSEFTPNKMQQPLHDDWNLEHYCAPVIHSTTR